ncbi:MAG: mechanosensitive ion channel family protein [SAR202 cluster bacterium]|jgi:small-conductance mechanosensitive channel|nr:mechanosensitive ion channel family protein [SAR202 cluster bacterium]MDP6512210.1 mechanosensitive ion channel family protein [SAR202 cluster bacterium]MDP6713932.1 mechanosensitive ion channel family protein [SAR202 cluster bacterium]
MLPDYVVESALWGTLYAAGVMAASLTVAAVVQLVFVAIIRRRRRIHPDGLDVDMFQTVKGPAVLFVVIMGLFLSYLTLTQITHPSFEVVYGRDSWAKNAWLIMVIIEFSYLGSHLIQTMMTWYLHNIATQTATDLDDKLIPPLRRVAPMIVYSIASLLVLDVIGIAITPMLAGLGIGGLAIALAVQPTLSNFFAGTYLISEGELNEGDYIELDKGPAGFVVEVGWRSTKIRNRINNLVIIPNSKMVDSIVTNTFSPTPAMNIVINCGVSYESDLEQVEKVVLEISNDIIEEFEHTVTDSEPFFGFRTFGDSNIDFFVSITATSRTGSFIVGSELIKRIHSRFKEEGIEINYPVRKLIPTESNGAANQDLLEQAIIENQQASQTDQ